MTKFLQELSLKHMCTDYQKIHCHPIANSVYDTIPKQSWIKMCPKNLIRHFDLNMVQRGITVILLSEVVNRK